MAKRPLESALGSRKEGGEKKHVVIVEPNEEDRNEDEEDRSDDDDSDSDPESASPAHNERPTKKQRKQLSAQEVQIARETAELFKSNIFKLQIDELIKEMKIKDSHIQKIEKVLHRLHHLISQVPASETLSLSQAEQLFNHRKVAIPFPNPKPTKANYTFAYSPPEDVSLVGSFGLKTGISQSHGSSPSIDIALTMPKSLFQPKDFLNYRALYKRAFYLAYLVEHLIPLSKKHHLPIKISYQFLNDDVLCPTLKLESIKTDNEEDLHFINTKFSINILVGFPFGVFDQKKLLPDKNCIRVQRTMEDDGGEGHLPPTPIYNASVLSLTAYDYYLKYLYTTKKSTEEFKHACVLGRLWLQQRGFGSSFTKGGFGHFEFAMLMAALLNGGGLNGNKILLHGFSSYQLFKGTIKYLATIDLSSGYLSFSSLVGESITSKYNPEGFNVPTVFDKNVKLNILWKMTNSSYSLLQSSAIETMELLNDVVRDRFDPILLQKSNVDYLQYDVLMSLTVPDSIYASFSPLEKISFITFENYFKNKLYVVLKNALKDRVTNISIFNERLSNQFPINKLKPLTSSSPQTFKIGLRLNPEEAEKLVTKGPNNEDEKAALKFKAFWGSRASLRRFKDGTIQYCVVWQPKENESIVLSIARYVLDLHIEKEISHNLGHEAASFSSKLPTPLLPATSNQVVTSLVSFNNLKNSFEELQKVISNIPVGIKHLLPASSGLRYTSVLQPVPFATSNPDFWNDLVLQLESSSKWPDEISALENTKTAFLLKISESLNKETAYKAFITKDDSITFNDHICLLNILTPEGYGFRIRALSERDEYLYLRAVANADKQKALAQDIYLQFNRKYLGVVKHTRTITSMAHHFPYYSGTVRLFKRWLDSQLMLTHFPEELLELIAIKPFVDPAPYTTPNSIENGFLQVLNYLSSWNWKENALILDLIRGTPTHLEDDYKVANLSDKLSIQAYRVIELNFTKIRQNDPSAIKTQFFIASKDDPSGILWSNEGNLPIATRLTVLARAAMLLIKEHALSESTIDLIFTPSLNDYDFVIYTKPSNLVVSSGVLPPNSFKNLVGTETSFPEDLTSKYDLNDAFFHHLNAKFGNILIFSTQKFSALASEGSNVICGLFIPVSLAKKKFKVTLGMDIKPLDGSKDEVVVNKSSIFSQISLLGGDLVRTIKEKK
ncbi:uncharacterized protein KQ657_004017 [Scheffersomyces spartinae]|uniref:U3 small nucleolar RNA-associated protein 22 n=1 Tax=Scheffersomyces spartinae TaxID=45513 RepID=A0A9P8AJI4_9ASCO|nr:uncharacterized protein KQ657_004017 [Scheffersomyces spartinae]KAG7194909.1 hypothetical protein KQ657_004017 [Scheffersomyces spartinae]